MSGPWFGRMRKGVNCTSGSVFAWHCVIMSPILSMTILNIGLLIAIRLSSADHQQVVM